MARQNEQDAGDYAHMAGFDGDWRDTWWSDDWLALLVERAGIEGTTRGLDVGCGAGHWGLRLLAHLPEASFVGVDREAGFFEAARERAASRGLEGRHEWVHAHGEALPFPDDAFDLATCQTVLMHVADAREVLAEMARVVRPGGVVLCAEPDNFANAASAMFRPPGMPVADQLAILEMQVVQARGKLALGHGDESVGGRLVGHMDAVGLERVGAWMNDRCAFVVPPYASRAEQLDVDMMLRHADEVLSEGGAYDLARERFLAGEGSEARFAELWAVAERVHARTVAALRDGTYQRAGGFLHYVVAGRVAAAPAAGEADRTNRR